MTETLSQVKRRRVAKTDAEALEDDFFSSQFSVPSSQAQSQRRYLSQRSNLQRSQVVKSGRRAPVNYYETVLLKAGLELEDSTTSVLKCEPIVFMHKLKTVLKASPDFPANVKAFLAGIEGTMKERESFLKLLECCQVAGSGVANGQERKPVQESLMKMFLLVDFLQLELIKLLFGFLMKQLDGLLVPAGEQENSIVGLVLSQLKFIDHVQNGDLVFEKVFELLTKAQPAIVVSDEIIFSLEDVIDVSKHDEALERLLKLRPKPKDFITPTTVQVFTEMCLSAETLRNIRRQVMQYAEDGCPVRFYPTLVKMLLKFNRSEEQESLTGIIHEIRKLVGSNLSIWRDGATSEDYVDLVFRSIFQALSASAVLYDCWVAAIRQLTDEEDHLAVDLLVLTMATGINEIKAVRIRKLMLKKIEKGMFTDAHTEQLVECYRRVLQSQLDCFMELIESCTREKNEQVCGFGVAAMRTLFTLDRADNRVVLNKIVGFICEMATVNVANRYDFLLGRCIGALRTLQQTHPKEIERSAELLLRILDISPALSLRQYRTLIGVIYVAAIPSHTDAASDPDSSQMRDNLEIIIKKQLLCDNKDIKKKGIVGLVLLVNHLSRVPCEEEELSSTFDSERTIGTVGEIPTRAGRSMANLVSMLFLSTNQSAELLAICYDELANMLSQPRTSTDPQWEKPFIIWLCDTITNEFQGTFVVEEIPTDVGGDNVTLVRKLCINERTDETVNAEAIAIAVNISGCVLAQKNRHSIVTYLLPMFRLLRTVHGIRYAGDLESINALLGCAIIVPEFYAILDDERRVSETYDEDVCGQLLDCYFYLCNWFREAINAFIGQAEADIRRKVLMRLKELVELEHRLNRMLHRNDLEYVPPVCDQINSVAHKKLKLAESTAPPVRTKADATLNLDATVSSETAIHFNEQSLLLRCEFAFRRIDPELVQLFQVPLVPNRILLSDQIGQSLALAEYRFLLENVTLALEQTDTIQVQVTMCLQEITERTILLHKKIQEGVNRLQLPSSNELMPLKSCFQWSLRLFTALLGWDQLKQDNGRTKLGPILVALAQIAGNATAKPTQHVTDLCKIILKDLIKRANTFQDLSLAVQLYRLGHAVGKFVDREHASKAAVRFTRSVLTTELHVTTKANILYSELLDGMLDAVSLHSLRQFVVEIGQDITGQGQEEGGGVKNFAGFKKQHYGILFRGLCRSFIRATQDEIAIRTGTNQRLKLWETSCEITADITNIVKQVQNAKIFTLYLRFVQLFVKLFLRTGLTVLETVLRSTPERATRLLSTLQHTTRYLHNVCCQTKLSKDNGAVAQIPAIREATETLVYRVKAALVANKCSSVFWMGNLKNKDLQGELIASQLTPPDDDDDEEPLDGRNGNADDDDDDRVCSDIADELSDDERGSRSDKGSSSRTLKSSQSKCF